MTEEVEVWRPVIGWEGAYEVSTLGRIRSVSRTDSNNHFRPGRILALMGSPAGYMYVNLSRNGVRQKRSVHTIACEAEHGARPSGQVARHLDGDPSNNRATNLAWGTYADNIDDAVRHGTVRHARGEEHGAAKLTRWDVLNIRSMSSAGTSQKDLAVSYGVNPSTISHIVRGRNWKSVI